MAIVYTTELTNANAKELYQTPSSFSISYVPGNGAPGNESTISYITINSNECDLVMSNMQTVRKLRKSLSKGRECGIIKI